MIRIIADATCNLSPEIAKKHHIKIAPSTVMVGGKKIEEYFQYSSEEFNDNLDSLDNLPITDETTSESFYDLIEDGVFNGANEFIIITASSKVNNTYNSAIKAVEEFNEKRQLNFVKMYVVDSKCISLGNGYLVLKTAMMRNEGASFEELINFNEKYKTRVKHFLSVSHIDSLVDNGLVSNARARLGRLFGNDIIKKMKNGGKGVIVERTDDHLKVFKNYINEYKKQVDESINKFIIIGYTSNIKNAKDLEALIIRKTNFKGSVYFMQMGSTMGTHAGLSAVSMFFIGK